MSSAGFVYVEEAEVYVNPSTVASIQQNRWTTNECWVTFTGGGAITLFCPALVVARRLGLSGKAVGDE